MADWQYKPYQGIDPNLLSQQVNAPNKNAAGLDALSGSLGGITQGLTALIGKQKLNDLIKQFLAPQGGQQQQGAGMMQGMPTMGQQPQQQNADPLGILGGGMGLG